MMDFIISAVVSNLQNDWELACCPVLIASMIVETYGVPELVRLAHQSPPVFGGVVQQCVRCLWVRACCPKTYDEITSILVVTCGASRIMDTFSMIPWDAFVRCLASPATVRATVHAALDEVKLASTVVLVNQVASSGPSEAPKVKWRLPLGLWRPPPRQTHHRQSAIAAPPSSRTRSAAPVATSAKCCRSA